VTRTPSFTQTPTGTATAVPTATPTCGGEVTWSLGAEQIIASQSGGRVWLTKTVPTEAGWGVFWLREDPGVSGKARVYYAHVDFEGRVNLSPRWIIDVPKISWRDRYYNVAWNGQHYGLITAERDTIYFHVMSWEGVLSGRKSVGPPLFTSTIYDQEADSDFDAYPGGFVGVIEGGCSGHSCSYVFRLGPEGQAMGSYYNLVDFDYTHQFWPKAAFDGTGFVVASVKDAVGVGGVVTKYVRPYQWGEPSNYSKVVTSKDYLWDEYPDIAYNGNYFASVWTEVSARPSSGPPAAWRIRFASFNRTFTSHTDMSNRVLDSQPFKSPYRWNKNVHAVGGDFVAHYSSWRQGDHPMAVFEYLDGAARTHARIEPFLLTADALGSSVHVLPEFARRVGVARGSSDAQGTTVSFHTLDPPVCR